MIQYKKHPPVGTLKCYFCENASRDIYINDFQWKSKMAAIQPIRAGWINPKIVKVLQRAIGHDPIWFCKNRDRTKHVILLTKEQSGKIITSLSEHLACTGYVRTISQCQLFLHPSKIL